VSELNQFLLSEPYKEASPFFSIKAKADKEASPFFSIKAKADKEASHFFNRSSCFSHPYHKKSNVELRKGVGLTPRYGEYSSPN
jgi:hypothetical protein